MPTDRYDWQAVDADTYDGAPDSHCAVGYGRTEADAIAALIELEDGKYAEQEMSDAEREARLADEHFGCYPTEER